MDKLGWEHVGLMIEQAVSKGIKDTVPELIEQHKEGCDYGKEIIKFKGILIGVSVGAGFCGLAGGFGLARVFM